MIFSGGFDSNISTALTVLTLIGSIFTVFYGLRFFGGIFFGKQGDRNLAEKTPKLLIVPTVAVTAFLIIEGLMPGALLTWVTKGLAGIFGGAI
jgi:NADH:ubiquinone oxidoreductase subunit 5 (subunit L)/multisubunit Na+/H+ antiporter MnhA subunit